MQIAYTPEQEALQARAARLLRRADDAGGRRPRSPPARPAARPASRPCGRWAATAGSASAGRRSTAARAGATSSSSSSPTRPGGPGAPIPFLTINTVGKTIMEYGSQEQKDVFLPKILAGELHFSIGYTEPSAGTDLASLRTTAVKDGDEWRINGQKIYTSLASYADYIWLAARTDPDAPKHKGISIFLVPTTDPGFSYTKIHTMVNAVDVQHLLRRRPGRRRRHRLRRQPRAGTSSSTSSTTSGSRSPRQGCCRAPTRTPCAGPRRHKLPRRPAGHRPGVGAAQPRHGAGQARVPAAHRLEGRLRRGGRATRPTPARRRCSAPSSRCEAYQLLVGGARPGARSCARARRARCSPVASSAACRAP